MSIDYKEICDLLVNDGYYNNEDLITWDLHEKDETHLRLRLRLLNGKACLFIYDTKIKSVSDINQLHHLLLGFGVQIDEQEDIQPSPIEDVEDRLRKAATIINEATGKDVVLRVPTSLIDSWGLEVGGEKHYHSLGGLGDTIARLEMIAREDLSDAIALSERRTEDLYQLKEDNGWMKCGLP